MRVLDDFEVSILKKIKSLSESGKDISLFTLADDYIEDRGFKIETYSKRIFLLFDSLKYTRLESGERIPVADLDSEARNLTRILIRIIIFIQYLEREGCCYKVASKRNPDNISYARISNNSLPVEWEVGDLNFYDVLTSYSYHYLYFSEGAIHYLSDPKYSPGMADSEPTIKSEGFYSQDVILETKNVMHSVDKNIRQSITILQDILGITEKRIRFADIALGIAILLGVVCVAVSAISTYYTYGKLEENGQLTVVQMEPLHRRLSSIEESFFKIHQKMDEIRIDDTIHTKIVSLPIDTISAKVINFPPLMNVRIKEKR